MHAQHKDEKSPALRGFSLFGAAARDYLCVGIIRTCEAPCGGGWLLQEVRKAAAMKNKLTIPLNSDMAKLPLFRPARTELTRKCWDAPARLDEL